MDWEVDTKPPRWTSLVFDVWVCGQVRRVIWNGLGFFKFLDCWHPAQNSLCDERLIQGWRLAEPKPLP